MTTTPASCSLSGSEYVERRDMWERLNERALREQRTTPEGMELDYAPDAETELRELARLEANCCSFAEWSVASDGGELRLRVTAPPDSVASVQALFGS